MFDGLRLRVGFFVVVGLIVLFGLSRDVHFYGLVVVDFECCRVSALFDCLVGISG